MNPLTPDDSPPQDPALLGEPEKDWLEDWGGVILLGGLAVVYLLGCLVGLVPTGVNVLSSPCDEMRAQQDRVAELEAALNDGWRNPERAMAVGGGREGIMEAYSDLARATDACTDSLTKNET